MRVLTRPSSCLYLRTPAAGSWLIEEKWRPKKRKEQLESESKLSTSRSGSRGGKDQATKQKKAWRLRAAPQRDGKKLNNSTTRKPNPSQRGKEKETCSSSTRTRIKARKEKEQFSSRTTYQHDCRKETKYYKDPDKANHIRSSWQKKRSQVRLVRGICNADLDQGPSSALTSITD